VYQPPPKYLEQHEDPAFFNHEYQQYYEHLKSGDEKGYVPLQPRSSSKTDEDREENTGLYSK